MTIALVSQGENGYAQGTGTTGAGTFTVTLQQAPINGSVLILCFLGNANSTLQYITGISQTNVTWTVAVAQSGNNYSDVEIWKGIVAASAGTTITVTVAGGTASSFGDIATVCEWSGLTGVVDKTKINAQTGHATTTSSGTTDATAEDVELWVGAIGGQTYTGSPPGTAVAQSTPTNGFTLLDGSAILLTFNLSLAYCYKIVSSTGAAEVGTTFSGDSYWGGCIATFKGSISTYSPKTRSSVPTVMCQMLNSKMFFG